MKKYIAELIGTLTLVFIGCGSAVIISNSTSLYGILGIAFAFGLSVVAMAYSFGSISGCHINPAVSIAMFIDKRMNIKDLCGYIVAQIIGAILGSGLLYFILNCIPNIDVSAIGLGANGFDSASTLQISMYGAIAIETILTFIFVLTVMSVTAKPEYQADAGLIIGLTLTLVHIIGIPFTGTSVNPARSLAPALILRGTALSQVWVFIVSPLIGAILAAFVYKFLSYEKEAKIVENSDE